MPVATATKTGKVVQVIGPVVDFGILGGLLYWGFMGLVLGYLYSLYLCKHPLGMCIYPVFYLALTEVPRYLSSTRFESPSL